MFLLFVAIASQSFLRLPSAISSEVKRRTSLTGSGISLPLFYGLKLKRSNCVRFWFLTIARFTTWRVDFSLLTLISQRGYLLLWKPFRAFAMHGIYLIQLGTTLSSMLWLRFPCLIVMKTKVWLWDAISDDWLLVVLVLRKWQLLRNWIQISVQWATYEKFFMTWRHKRLQIFFLSFLTSFPLIPPPKKDVKLPFFWLLLSYKNTKWNLEKIQANCSIIETKVNFRNTFETIDSNCRKRRCRRVLWSETLGMWFLQCQISYERSEFFTKQRKRIAGIIHTWWYIHSPWWITSVYRH